MKIDECEQDILRALAEDDRDVWTVEQFEEIYGTNIVVQAIDRLRKSKKISLSQERGLRGSKVKVVRRR